MTPTHLSLLRCAHCFGKLDLQSDKQNTQLKCIECKKTFPIIADVAILVKNPEEYIYLHAKGISRFVDKNLIPKKYQDAYLTALEQINESEFEHIEEDLEAERVNALYIMNHFIDADSKNAFWKNSKTETNSEIESLILKYWNANPIIKIAENFKKNKIKNAKLVELGCGVGGLLKNLAPHLDTYLGIDQSFASVAFAKKLFHSKENEIEVKIPQDLIDGTVSKKIKIKKPNIEKTKAEFIVADVESPPIAEKAWTHSAALNVIDMLDEPEEFVKTQNRILEKNGIAIESSPYIWHQKIAQKLKKKNPKAQNSAEMIRDLYKNSGFTIQEEIENHSWLFFKHFRQLEIYSTHIIYAVKR